MLSPTRTFDRCETPTPTSPPMPRVDTFTPMPIGMRPSADCFAGTAGSAAAAGAAAPDGSNESGTAAASCNAAKFVSNRTTVSTGTFRMAAPRKNERSICETVVLLSGSNRWLRVTGQTYRLSSRVSAATVRPRVPPIELLHVKLLRGQAFASVALDRRRPQIPFIRGVPAPFAHPAPNTMREPFHPLRRAPHQSSPCATPEYPGAHWV